MIFFQSFVVLIEFIRFCFDIAFKSTTDNIKIINEQLNLQLLVTTDKIKLNI